MEEKKRLEREAIIAGAARASPAPSPEKPGEAPGGGRGYVPPTRRGAGGGHPPRCQSVFQSVDAQSWSALSIALHLYRQWHSMAT